MSADPPVHASLGPAGPGREETCIIYEPYPWYARVFFTVLFLCAAVGFAVLALLTLRDVTVDCSHATGQCVLTRTYPMAIVRRELIALDAIRGTGLRGRATKNGGRAYAVTLVTAAGEDTLSSTYAPRGRQAQKRALDAFLADPDAPPLHLAYDTGSPFGLLLLFAPLVWLYVLWTLWQQARLRFETWRGAIVLERRRWPLAPWSRAFQRQEVTGAYVDERIGRRQTTYRVVLTLASGEEVPLLTVGGSGSARHEAFVAGIRTALGR